MPSLDSLGIFSDLNPNTGRDQNGGFFHVTVILIDLISWMPSNSVH